jgi:hypothetical protein
MSPCNNVVRQCQRPIALFDDRGEGIDPRPAVPRIVICAGCGAEAESRIPVSGLCRKCGSCCWEVVEARQNLLPATTG